MPIPGARYRMKGGVRLAFQGDKVVETKNMKTGAMHTPEEFKMDRDRTKHHQSSTGERNRGMGSKPSRTKSLNPSGPPNSRKRSSQKVKKSNPGHFQPGYERQQLDSNVHSQLVGMLRGKGETYT